MNTKLLYLLDTNILSEPLKPKPDNQVIKYLTLFEGTVATASVVIQELTYGYQRLPLSKRREKIENYVFGVQQTLPILPYDTAAALWHGTERARLEKRGLTAPFVDGQIAAIAKHHELTLVTRNIGNFRHFEGLKIENWFSNSPYAPL